MEHYLAPKKLLMPCRRGLWNNINSRSRKGDTLKLFICPTCTSLPYYIIFYKCLNNSREPLRPMMKEDMGSGSFFSSSISCYYCLRILIFNSIFNKFIPDMASFFSQIQLKKILGKSPVYKGDAKQIEDYLLSNGINCLYHYTDRSNLDSIREYGLFSSLTCQRLNIKNKPGGNTLSHKLDLDHHLDDFVRLSFVGRLPMTERLLKEGYDLVMLKVSIKVAGFLQTFFTDRNAADKDFMLGSDFAFVKHINEPQGYFDPYKLQQSEVLVRTHVPKEFILNLDDPMIIR